VIGSPFVGPAGKLFDHIASESLGVISFAVTNLVACYPREAKRQGTNEPPKEAIKACKERLKEFASLCRPQLVVLVGKLAQRSIPGESNFRNDNLPKGAPWVPEGEFLKFAEIYHPASILRVEDEMAKSLAVKRCVATISSAVEGLV
jgi:uracil-DNA glycosylase family 4